MNGFRTTSPRVGTRKRSDFPPRTVCPRAIAYAVPVAKKPDSSASPQQIRADAAAFAAGAVKQENEARIAKGHPTMAPREEIRFYREAMSAYHRKRVAP